MTERSIVEAAARLRQQREPYLVATVVSTRGSAYRPPGTRMVLTRFRWIAGAVTGGCLEGDFASDAWWRTRDGDVVLATYDGELAGAGDLDLRAALGLGDGAVEVLLERIGAPGRIDALAFAERCLRTRRRGAIATVYRSTDPGVRIGARVAIADGGELEHEVGAPAPLVRGAITEALREAIASGTPSHRSYESARGALDVLVEPVLPPPCLFVFGTGLDALPVAQLARALGWDVVVCAREPRCAIRDRFTGAEVVDGPPGELAARIAETDRAAAVVMNHERERDRDTVAMLLDTPVRYIGVLGPRERAQQLLAELGIEAPDPRVHAPAGLAAHATTPHELALAVLAEAQEVLHRAPVAAAHDPDGTIPERIHTGSGSAAAVAAAALE